MGRVASQITSLTIVYSTVYSDTDQRKHQSSASLAFVRGIHRGPVNSPHKWPVTRKMFPFDDVIMNVQVLGFGVAYIRALMVCFYVSQSKCSTARVERNIWLFPGVQKRLNLRSLKISTFYKNCMFQCTGKIFCVEFQRYPLKFHTKYLTHTLKDVYFIHRWKFKSSYI